METKQCTKCGAEKPHTDFHKDSLRKDGLNSWCITCVREARKNNYGGKRKVGEAAYKSSRENIKNGIIIYKQCIKCDITQSEMEFNKNVQSKDGLQSWCITCARDQSAIYEKTRGKFIRIKKKYGITKEEYHNLIESQNGLCPICNLSLNGDSQIDIDHNHKTNKVRGVLHTLCNKGLGCFDDEPQRFRNAIKYLENNG